MLGRRRVTVQCSNNGTSAVAVGAKVKVVKPIKVYHVPKAAAGLDIEGLEGVVVRDESVYKGKVLSANCPFKVEFNTTVPSGDKVKFIAHLAEEEMQQVA